MSTGDQSQYIRSKIAQRGLERGAHFMEDGFDRWAESNAPARAGQMEKMGSEPMAENYGGAMTLKHAKKLQMRGGLIPIPAPVQKAIDEAKKLVALWRGLSSFLTKLKNELRDEVINNPDQPQSWKNTATTLLGFLDGLGGMQTVLDGVASFVGSGHGGSMRGGATTIESIGKIAQQIAAVYGWFKENLPSIYGILELRAMNEDQADNIGNKIVGVLKPIFGAVGLGRGGKKCAKKHCMCDGGALPVLDVNTGTMVTKPNANRKKGGRRMSCSSDEMGARKVGGNKLYDASPQGQAQMMKEITGMGRKRGGVGLLEKLELMNPADRKHYDYNTVIKPSRVVGGRKRGGVGLLEKLELMNPADRKHYEYETVIKPSRVVSDDGAYDRMMAQKNAQRDSIQRQEEEMMAQKMANRAPRVGLGRKGGRGMEPRSLMSFPESMGSGKSKLKVKGGKKPSARGEIVKKVMREQGLSLPQASKYVKEHGLY